MANEQTELKSVSIKTSEIEMPSIDVSAYIGKRVKISAVQEMQGKFGYCVKIESGVLDTLKLGKEKVVELKASRIFGLLQDEEGNIGWTKQSALGLFLKKMGVAHYNDLKNKEVVVQATTGKDGKEYLTF